MRGRPEADVPTAAVEQRDYFEPDVAQLQRTQAAFMKDKAGLLKKLLVHRSPLMPTGVLLFCLDYAAKPNEALAGIFTSVRERFASLAKTDLPGLVKGFYEFRNTYNAHSHALLYATK